MQRFDIDGLDSRFPRFSFCQTLDDLAAQNIVGRIWARDHTVWKSEDREISNRLGCLHSPDEMLPHVQALETFVQQLRNEQFTTAVLLGMGGSSLAPEMFRKVFGVREGFLDLTVLDSTDPGAVLEVQRAVDLKHTLFVVSTKSGSTVETLSAFKYFYNLIAPIADNGKKAGNHFIAITDPASPLAELAARYNFRSTFLNNPDIGGRYSALSYFGLVPAALIGLNLAGSSVSAALGSSLTLGSRQEWLMLAVSATTLCTAAAVAVYLRGFLGLLPVLFGVLAGSALALALGLWAAPAAAKVQQAAWLGLPPFQTPHLDPGAAVMIAPLFLVLLAENKGHLDAIGAAMGRDLRPYLGRAYLGDALATLLSALGGGTPQTTYAENMGVMAITGMFAVRAFAAAAVVAMGLGVCPKFGALVQAVPDPVLGGITLFLYGMITLMGVRIWQESRVDFSQPRNLAVAGVSVTLATGLGVRGLVIHGVGVSGIALGTLLALVLNLTLRPSARV